MVNLYSALKSVDFYKKVTIREMLCIEYKCMDQREYFNFWTDCGCIVYCTAGKKLYSSNAIDFEVKPGAVFYMKKGAYTGKNYLDEQYCALMFFTPDSFYKNFLHRFPNLKLKTEEIENLWEDGIIPLQIEPSLEAYFTSIFNYFANIANISKELLSVKLDELIINIFTQPKHKHFAAYLSSLELDRTTNIRNIMEENFASNLKLAEFAQLCNLSLSTFKREFSKIYGSSPAKWFLKRKLQLSQRLLRHSEKSVNEISFQCGFESPSHFIRVFKKEFGSTPLKYKEKMKDD